MQRYDYLHIRNKEFPWGMFCINLFMFALSNLIRFFGHFYLCLQPYQLLLSSVAGWVWQSCLVVLSWLDLIAPFISNERKTFRCLIGGIIFDWSCFGVEVEYMFLAMYLMSWTSWHPPTLNIYTHTEEKEKRKKQRP